MYYIWGIKLCCACVFSVIKYIFITKDLYFMTSFVMRKCQSSSWKQVNAILNHHQHNLAVSAPVSFLSNSWDSTRLSTEPWAEILSLRQFGPVSLSVSGSSSSFPSLSASLSSLQQTLADYCEAVVMQRCREGEERGDTALQSCHGANVMFPSDLASFKRIVLGNRPRVMRRYHSCQHWIHPNVTKFRFCSFYS